MCKHSAFVDDRLRAFAVSDYRKGSEQGSRGSPRTVLDVDTVFSASDSYHDDNDDESDELWAQLAPLTIDNGNKSGNKNGSRNRNGKEAPLSIFTAGAPISSPKQRSKLPLLNYCSLCLRSLLPGTDIFMYRGERAFCSDECRYNQILMDEECHESCGASSKNLEPYPTARQARRTLLTFDGI